jgi:large subunit ribosomal protein L13e
VLERIALGIPIINEPVISEAKIKDVKGEDEAYRKLRLARSDARLVGVREKRAKAKAEEAEAKKK